MNQKEINRYAFIGWAIYNKKYSLKQLEDMPDFDFIMLMEEWEKFKELN